MPRDFPEIKDGDPIEPWHFNIIYRELRRWQRATYCPPLVVSHAKGSTPPIFSLGGFPIAKVGKASGSISARSGSTYGTGVFTLQDDSGTTLSDGESVTQPCKNLIDKTIATGSYIIVVWVDESWWVVAVGTCSNLS